MKRTTKNKLALLVCVLFLMAIIPPSALAVDGQIKISQTPSTTFPIVINQPGSYVLTSDIVVSASNTLGIEITVDNVNLDLNGYTLTGPGYQNSHAIFSTKSNISVYNGTIRDWHTGVRFDGGENGSNYLVKQIKAYRCSQGITVEGSGAIINCITNNGGTGIFAHYCTISNCTASENEAWGMGLDHSIVTDCVLIHNGWPGITALDSTITNCVANLNHYNGSSASGAGFEVTNSIVTNCTANGNFGNGITAHNGSRIEGNNVRNNTKYGLYLMAGQNYAAKNTADNNISGNFFAITPGNNYMPTSLTGADAANTNIGW